MSYQTGDCLVLPGFKTGYIVVYVAGVNEQSYFLAFLYFQGATPPTPAYFEICSFFVATFGPPEQQHAAFETVSIGKALLDSASDVRSVAHLEIGAFGQMGLTPMLEVADVAAFYDENFAEIGAKAKDDILQVFTRTFMSIDEVKKKATQANPLPTVKLYKQASETLHFWHIFANASAAALVTCWGPLGKYEGYEEIKAEELNSLKDRYRLLIEEKRAEGYRERDNYSEMILQFHTNDEWGNTDDLAFRNQIWDALNEHLYWSGLGEVAGGDIGSGTVNLFFRTVSTDMAVQLIKDLLEAKQIHRPYIIAVEHDNDHPGKVNVIYPLGHTAEFNY
jgi:hypothetical protein